MKEQVIRGVLDMARAIAEKTKARGDDLIVSILEAALERFGVVSVGAAGDATSGPSKYESLDDESKAMCDDFVTGCSNCDDGEDCSDPSGNAG